MTINRRTFLWLTAWATGVLVSPGWVMRILSNMDKAVIDTISIPDISSSIRASQWRIIELLDAEKIIWLNNEIDTRKLSAIDVQSIISDRERSERTWSGISSLENDACDHEFDCILRTSIEWVDDHPASDALEHLRAERARLSTTIRPYLWGTEWWEMNISEKINDLMDREFQAMEKFIAVLIERSVAEELLEALKMLNPIFSEPVLRALLRMHPSPVDLAPVIDQCFLKYWWMKHRDREQIFDPYRIRSFRESGIHGKSLFPNKIYPLAYCKNDDGVVDEENMQETLLQELLTNFHFCLWKIAEECGGHRLIVQALSILKENKWSYEPFDKSPCTILYEILFYREDRHGSWDISSFSHFSERQIQWLIAMEDSPFLESVLWPMMDGIRGADGDYTGPNIIFRIYHAWLEKRVRFPEKIIRQMRATILRLHDERIPEYITRRNPKLSHIFYDTFNYWKKAIFETNMGSSVDFLPADLESLLCSMVKTMRWGIIRTHLPELLPDASSPHPEAEYHNCVSPWFPKLITHQPIISEKQQWTEWN